jgi:hypothetical protein
MADQTDPYANGICTYGETRAPGSGCIKPAGHLGGHLVTDGDTDAEPPAAPTYPHPDGETTVLGPEIFASSDGEVVCWRGVNYVRQAASAVVPSAVDRAELRARIAHALLARIKQATISKQRPADALTSLLAANEYDLADAVLALLPATTDRAAVLREAEGVLRAEAKRMTGEFNDSDVLHEDGPAAAVATWKRAADLLRRMAAETPQPETRDEEIALLRLTVDAVEEGRRELRSENARLRSQLWTLAAMLDGLHTLIATSSRDWQTYRVDAWLWAVLCGWDCEQTEHDETCTHGALEETAAMHGWDDDTVAKARRYRATVRVITGPAPAPAVVAQPAKEAEEPKQRPTPFECAPGNPCHACAVCWS